VTLAVVYDLDEYVASRASDNQTWTAGGAFDLLAQTVVTTATSG
jgi:hypothetical protein